MIDLPANMDLSPGSAGKATPRRHHHFHRHAHEHNLTRRQFLKAGFALAGAAAGAGLLQGTSLAARRGTGIPPQVAGFSPALKDTFGVEIPFFLPVEIDPFTAAPGSVSPPTTIWDFNGFVGMVEADGVSNPAHTSDDEPRRWACDIRFMKGVFVDREGNTQRGAFGFF